MFRIFPKISSILCALTISACTPYYINTENLGSAVDDNAEIARFFAGKSFAYDSGGMDYYAPDGTYKAISPDGRSIGVGEWSVGAGLLETMCEKYILYSIENGRTKTSGPYQSCYRLHIDENGNAALDKMGGGNTHLPKPVRGFPRSSKFNSARRNMGI